MKTKKSRTDQQPQKTGSPPATDVLDLREVPGGVRLRVRVQPRAAREGLAGVRQGALLVRLTAPPVDGAANQALLRLLAKTLGVAPSAITLEQGQTGREKLLHIAGVSRALALARFGQAPG